MKTTFPVLLNRLATTPPQFDYRSCMIEQYRQNGHAQRRSIAVDGRWRFPLVKKKNVRRDTILNFGERHNTLKVLEAER